jgi:hypothetical protein
MDQDMDAIISQLIAQLNSSVFVLLGILVIAAWTLYNLGKWKERWINHDKRVDKIESIHDKVIILETKIQLIYDNTNPRKTVAASSPIGLTPLGKEIAESIEAEKIFEKHKDKLLEKLNQGLQDDCNPYDIQAGAMDLAKKYLPKIITKMDINKIKQEAFRYGIIDEDVFAIFGVYLRDCLLEQRGISINDVDKYDPQLTLPLE